MPQPKRRTPVSIVAAVAPLLLAGAGASAEVHRIATGLDRPVFATAPPLDHERLFVVLQGGTIRILDLATETLAATPFLTIPGVVASGEEGLLGLAFHPDYEGNGLFYVNYTAAGLTVIAEYGVSAADPDVADPAERRLLSYAQPQTNHNGGWIGFGPRDGFLYIGSGDGGGANDTGAGHAEGIGNAQDTSSLLGKMLRIDVDADDFPGDPDRNYAIPPDNPFVGVAGADEIWSYGLRNPFRASFDRATGNLFIGDVGQNAREEIDVQPDGMGGLDFGWRLREGTIATPTIGIGGEAPGAIEPIFDYEHPGGESRSVTGGVVYRGPTQALRGRYFFGDFSLGWLLSLRFDGSDPADFDGTNISELTVHTGDPAFAPDAGTLERFSAFGEDARGRVYIVKLTNAAFAASSGEIFRLPEPSPVLAAVSAVATLLGLRRAAQRRS